MAVKSLAQSSIRQAPPVNSMLAGYSFQDFHHLETVRLGGPAASITFTNLLQYSTEFRHLQVRVAAVGYTTFGDYHLTFNNDTTATNYYSHALYSTGTGVGVGAAQAPTVNYQWFSGDNASVIDILDAFDPTKFTTVRALSGNTIAGAGTNFLGSVLWRSLAPLSSLSYQNVRQNHGTGSRFSLYGIR